jgi:hypothetical protein
MKFEFSREVLEKYSNIKFHKNLSVGTELFPSGKKDGHPDRHDEANSRFSQFCERV